MRNTEYQITLDVQSVISQVSIPVPQGDTARTLVFHLRENGELFSLPNGCRAVFTAIKDDGTELFNDCIIEEEKRIRYTFTEQTTAAVGKTDCQLKIYGEDGGILASPRFTIVVYRSAYSAEEIVSSNEFGALDTLYSEAAALVDTVEKKLANGEFNGVGIRSIVRTSGTGSPGTVDTYTITMTDETKYKFTVYNGANGIGSGGEGGGGTAVYISDTNPGVAGAIWFNTSGIVPTDEASLLRLTDNTDTDVVAEVNGTEYGVENIESAGETDGTYNYTLI